MKKIGYKIWGLDEDGELRRVYRPSGHPGLWFVPGAIQHARFHSKHLVSTQIYFMVFLFMSDWKALQIIAEELGLIVN